MVMYLFFQLAHPALQRDDVRPNRVALHHPGDIRAKIVKHLNRPLRQKKPRRLFIRDGEAAIPLCLSLSERYAPLVSP